MNIGQKILVFSGAVLASMVSPLEVKVSRMPQEIYAAQSYACPEYKFDGTWARKKIGNNCIYYNNKFGTENMTIYGIENQILINIVLTLPIEIERVKVRPDFSGEPWEDRWEGIEGIPMGPMKVLEYLELFRRYKKMILENEKNIN